MDHIKVAKVDRVLCTRPKSQSHGTLHLTAHHLIFKFDEEAHEQEAEMWVPYPLISLVTRLPQTLEGLSPLAFRCRTFETFSLTFEADSEALDVFESIRELTVATSVNQLYAFDYKPNPAFDSQEGWNIYNPREEFTRMGLGTRTKAWRFTDINKDYNFCSTYPARLVVPSRISDTTLTYAAKYRSKARIPALVYLHWSNLGSITRSSQPMVGLTNNRSIQDEKLIEAIFQSHLYHDSALTPQSESRGGMKSPAVYGATATNLIIDARPTTNAMVMSVKGAGTENMEYYKDGKKAYLGVDNIHVMRESLSKVAEALRDADIVASLPGYEGAFREGEAGSFVDRQALRKSGWLRHISAILDGTLIIVRNVHINSSHVLIHCSDGWDRTAQLSSLSQICLDPFYRTIRGFQILVEKDWLSFGHKFADRCGHMSSEKFFMISTGDGTMAAGRGADSAQAFFASVQNKFTPQSHLKETSPVFHQFLECVRQLQRQFPSRFEYNEHFLERLHYHLYSCQFGTFLFNCERERRVGEPGALPPTQTTKCIWDFLNSSFEKTKFLNPEYDPTLDDRSGLVPKGDMGVLLPDPKDVRFWHELYGRTDEEMNGRMVTAQAVGVEVTGPVEGNEDDPVRNVSLVAAISPLSPSPSPSPAPSSDRTSTRNYYSAGETVSTPETPVTPQPAVSQRPTESRKESFRAYESSPSTFSMHSSSSTLLPLPPALSPTRSEPRSPAPRRWNVDTSAAGGGMKSMWASLSSNATAALSVVQGAVDGVAKDLRVPSLAGGWNQSGGDGELVDKTGHMSIHDRWQADDDGRAAAWEKAHGQVSNAVSDNPWSTSTPSSTPLYVDAPSARDPSISRSFTSSGFSERTEVGRSQSLGPTTPVHTSIAAQSLPSLRASANSSPSRYADKQPARSPSPRTSSHRNSPQRKSLTTPLPPTPQPPSKGSSGTVQDPLGVGFLS